MNIAELDTFFVNLDPGLCKGGTSDGLRFGSPDQPIAGIVTTHMATMQVIRQAIQIGCNTIISHEAPFFSPDDPHAGDRVSGIKKDLLEENGIAIYRLHDLWDNYPQYGVADSWAAHLALGAPADARGRLKVYDIPTQFLSDFSERVKEMMRLPVLRVAGDLASPVSRVGLGPGEHGRLEDLNACMEMGCDCFVAGESSESLSARYATDSGISMIVTGHTESENPGLESLAAFLKEHFPDIKIEFLDAGAVYSYV